MYSSLPPPHTHRLETHLLILADAFGVSPFRRFFRFAVWVSRGCSGGCLCARLCVPWCVVLGNRLQAGLQEVADKEVAQLCKDLGVVLLRQSAKAEDVGTVVLSQERKDILKGYASVIAATPPSHNADELGCGVGGRWGGGGGEGHAVAGCVSASASASASASPSPRHD